MNRYSIFGIFLIFYACSPKLGENDVCMIDGKIISADYFFNLVPRQEFVALDSLGRIERLDAFVMDEIISREARDRDLDTDTLFIKEIESFRYSLVVGRLLKENVVNPLLSDSSLRRLYEKMGRTVGVHQILIKFRGERATKVQRSEQEALDLTLKIRREIEDGQISFEKAAFKYSEGPFRYREGFMGDVRWGDLFEPVQTVAFYLPWRTVSDPVKSHLGYHLIWVKSIRPVVMAPFEEEIPRLKEFILSGKGHEVDVAMKRYRSGLFSRYEVSFNRGTIHEITRSLVSENVEEGRWPKASGISDLDVRGIVFTVEGDAYDVEWVKKRIAIDKSVSRLAIRGQRNMREAIEKLLFDFLAARLAEKRDKPWHREIDGHVARRKAKTLRERVLKHLQEKDSSKSNEQWIAFLRNSHHVTINEDVVVSYPVE